MRYLETYKAAWYIYKYLLSELLWFTILWCQRSGKQEVESLRWVVLSWHGRGITPSLYFLSCWSLLKCTGKEETYPGKYVSFEYVLNRGNKVLNGAKFCLYFCSGFTVWYVLGLGVISCFREKDQYVRGWDIHIKPSKQKKTKKKTKKYRIIHSLFICQLQFNHLQL